MLHKTYYARGFGFYAITQVLMLYIIYMYTKASVCRKKKKEIQKRRGEKNYIPLEYVLFFNGERKMRIPQKLSTPSSSYTHIIIHTKDRERKKFFNESLYIFPPWKSRAFHVIFQTFFSRNMESHWKKPTFFFWLKRDNTDHLKPMWLKFQPNMCSFLSENCIDIVLQDCSFCLVLHAF